MIFDGLDKKTALKDGTFQTFDELGNQVYAPGQKDFWTFDAGVRYRLPKRYGFLVAGVNNLGNELSTYQSTDPKNLALQPGRVIYGRVVLAVP